jgi:hypothetical protein
MWDNNNPPPAPHSKLDQNVKQCIGFTVVLQRNELHCVWVKNITGRYDFMWVVLLKLRVHCTSPVMVQSFVLSPYY